MLIPWRVYKGLVLTTSFPSPPAATPRDTPLDPGPGRHLQRGGRDSTRSTRRFDGPGRGRSTGDGGGGWGRPWMFPGAEVWMSINGDRIHGL